MPRLPKVLQEAALLVSRILQGPGSLWSPAREGVLLVPRLVTVLQEVAVLEAMGKPPSDPLVSPRDK